MPSARRRAKIKTPRVAKGRIRTFITGAPGVPTIVPRKGK